MKSSVKKGLDNETVRLLEKKANEIRKDVIKMISAAKSGHPAGSLGMADVFAVLYFHALNHKPKRTEWKDRDRLILSNGHICPVRYAAMAHAGYFPKKELMTLRKFGSRLQGHPEVSRMQALETTSGPLGEGIAQAAGIAYAGRMDGAKWRVFCVTGDGELQEGICWESFLFIAKENISNLIVIVDRNYIQIDGFTEDITKLDPLKLKFEAFGFNTIVIDGHSIEKIAGAIEEARLIQKKPTVIIANTIPGKGVDFMERKPEWHGRAPNAQETKEALKQLSALDKKYN